MSVAGCIHLPPVTGYHAIGKGHNMPDDGLAARPGSARAFQLPELEHNLNLLVDMTEEDILVTERRSLVLLVFVMGAGVP